jgi:hypothetical protein
MEARLLHIAPDVNGASCKAHSVFMTASRSTAAIRDEIERTGGLARHNGKSLALNPSEQAAKFVETIAASKKMEIQFKC